MTALKDLLAKVEAGLDTAHDHARAFPSESAYGHCTWHDSHKASGGDLNAAKSLHDAVLPGWKWGRQWSCHMWVETDDMPGRSERHYGNVSDPARAWLIAVLRALIAQEGEA